MIRSLSQIRSVRLAVPVTAAALTLATLAMPGVSQPAARAATPAYAAATETPVVTSLGSSLGRAAGGKKISITGRDFAARAAVYFGKIRSPQVTVVSATLIEARVPALPTSDSALTVAVRVKNPLGPISSYNAAAVYRYYTPDWSAYLGGGSHTSFNPAATTVTPASMSKLRPIWQWRPSDAPDGGLTADFASPIAYHGVVYVGLEDGNFYAINEATQQLAWPSPVYLGLLPGTTCGTAPFGIISTATVATDPVTGKPVVYVNGPDGYLYALDAATGAVLWKSLVGIPSTTVNDYYAWGSPTVANGKVYIGISSNCDVPLVPAGVLEINQHTGTRIAFWHSQPKDDIGASVWSSVVVLPNGDVAATTGNSNGNKSIPEAEAISLLSGTNLKQLGTWAVPPAQGRGDSDFGGSPTVFTAYPHGVATTMLGACNKDGIYYAVRAFDLKAGPLWTRRMGRHTTGPEENECDAAAIWNGKYLIEGAVQAKIRGTTYQGSVQALNPTTGKPIWQTGVGGWIVGSPSEDGAGVVAAPVLYSPNGVSGVYLLSAKTGKILKFISTEPQGLFAQPVWDGKDLLIGDNWADEPLTAYTVTTWDQTAQLAVDPPDLERGTSATLTLTETGGAGFTSAPNVIVSGAQVVVQSVTVENSTTLSVQVEVESDAQPGAALNVTAIEPGSLTAYWCTSCLAIK
jgi:polyvinyl alcohol dehydrogenase (cytochrome)